MNILLSVMLGICAIYEIIKAQYELSFYKYLVIPAGKHQVKMVEPFQMEILFFHHTGRFVLYIFDVWELLVVCCIVLSCPQLWWLSSALTFVIWINLIYLNSQPETYNVYLHKTLHVGLAFIMAALLMGKH
jgi:hypothetical protein